MLILCTMCLLVCPQSISEDILISSQMPCMDEAAVNYVCHLLDLSLKLQNVLVSLNQGSLLSIVFAQYRECWTLYDFNLATLKCHCVMRLTVVHVHGRYLKRTLCIEYICSYMKQTEEEFCKDSTKIHAKYYFANAFKILDDLWIEKKMSSLTQQQTDGEERTSSLTQMVLEGDKEAIEILHSESRRGSDVHRIKIINYVFNSLQLEEVIAKSWTSAIFVIYEYINSYGFLLEDHNDIFARSSEEIPKNFSASEEIQRAIQIVFPRAKLVSIYESIVYIENMTLTQKGSNFSIYCGRFNIRKQDSLRNICKSDMFILASFQNRQTILVLYIHSLVEKHMHFRYKPNYSVCLFRKHKRNLSNWNISQSDTCEKNLHWRYLLKGVIVNVDSWQSKFQCDQRNTIHRNNPFDLLRDISCDMLHDKDCTSSIYGYFIIKNTSFMFLLFLMILKLFRIHQCEIDKRIMELTLTFLTRQVSSFSYCNKIISNTLLLGKCTDLCGDELKMRKTRKPRTEEHSKKNHPSFGSSYYEDNEMHKNKFFQGYGVPWKMQETTKDEYAIKSIPWYLRLRAKYIQPFATILPLTIKEYIKDKVNTSQGHRSQLMKYEWERYKSFQNFPSSSPVHPIRLAQAGFYYSNVADEVTCFSCGIKCREWRNGDIPNEMHAQKSPVCSFLSRRNINIPIAREERIQEENNQLLYSNDAHAFIVEDVDSDMNRNSSLDYCTNAPSNNFDLFDRDSERQSGFPIESSPGNLILQIRSQDNEEMQIFNEDNRLLCGFEQKENAPKYPQYSVLLDRVKSYTGWPICTQQEPKQLAEAGLFYTGSRDCVRCYQCGGGLRNWEQNDVPFNEHARWYPDCLFVLRCSEIEFIGEHHSEEDRVNGLDPTQYSQVPSENDNDASSSACANTVKENALHTEPVRIVLEMGFSVDTVQTAVKSLQERQRNVNISAADLLEVLLLIQNTENDIGSASLTSVPMARIFARNIAGESEKTHALKVKEITCKEKADGSRRKDANTVIDGNNSDTSAAGFSQKDYESIMEENSALKDQITCKICMDAEACIVFLPCSHMMTCPHCAPAFRKCPMCRQIIRGTIRAHM